MTKDQIIAAYKVIGFGQVMVDAIEELKDTRFFKGKAKAYMSDFQRKYEQWEKVFYKGLEKEYINEAFNISKEVEKEFEKTIGPLVQKGMEIEEA